MSVACPSRKVRMTGTSRASVNSSTGSAGDLGLALQSCCCPTRASPLANGSPGNSTELYSAYVEISASWRVLSFRRCRTTRVAPGTLSDAHRLRAFVVRPQVQWTEHGGLGRVEVDLFSIVARSTGLAVLPEPRRLHVHARGARVGRRHRRLDAIAEHGLAVAICTRVLLEHEWETHAACLIVALCALTLTGGHRTKAGDWAWVSDPVLMHDRSGPVVAGDPRDPGECGLGGVHHEGVLARVAVGADTPPRCP